MRLDPAPLLAQFPGETGEAIAGKLGVTRRTIERWKSGGNVDPKLADALAVKAGTHAFVLWPELAEQAVADVERVCEATGCDVTFLPVRRTRRFCSDRCRARMARPRERAAQRERYRTDPEFRARKQAQVRANREASKRALAVKRKLRYRANADELRAKRREQYAANAEKEKARQAAYRARKREQAA